MENLESVVSRNNLDLYSVVFKCVLPLPVMYGTFPADREIWTKYNRDEINKNYPEIAEFLWAGSKQEGLFVPITENQPNNFVHLMSDIDLIAVLCGFVADDRSDFIADDRGDSSSGVITNEIFAVKPASHPGYLQLLSEAGEIISIRYDSDCSGRVQFKRNGTVAATVALPVEEIVHKKVLPLISYTEKYVHGPALCFKVKTEHPTGDSVKASSSAGSDVDVVLALKMNSWPRAADGWIRRERKSGWPSEDLINQIIKSDIYIVPVGHPKSDDPDNEWRYSFTIPERFLGHSLNVFQRACYNLAKILLKSAIPENQGISSYFLKTLLFWLCEEIPEREWRTDKMGYFVMVLIYRLRSRLQKKDLRHYFIQENNMIHHIEEQILEDAIQKLSMCIQDPLSIVFRFTELTRYYGFYVHPPKEIYNPLISLFRGTNISVDPEILNPVLKSLFWEFARRYSSWLKRDIAPPGDSITRPFAEMKFRLLLSTAKAIQDKEEKENFDEIIESFAEEIKKYNAGNATEFKSFAKSETRIF